MSTDTDWDKWGETDPYFGVLSSDEYRAGNLSEEHRAKFFDSGSDYIDRMLATVREHLDSDFEPVSALDFGCGVGRLVIPLANVATTVVGMSRIEGQGLQSLVDGLAGCARDEIRATLHQVGVESVFAEAAIEDVRQPCDVTLRWDERLRMLRIIALPDPAVPYHGRAVVRIEDHP